MSNAENKNSYWKDKKTITLSSEQLSALERIQKKKHFAINNLLAFIPIFFTIAIIAQKFPSAMILIIFYMVFLIYIGISYTTQKCPNCKNNFFWSMGLSNALANKCVHCGLNLYETENNTKVLR